MVWGIFYSDLNDEEKQALLNKHLNPNNLEEILKICERKHFIDLIAKWDWEINNSFIEINK